MSTTEQLRKTKKNMEFNRKFYPAPYIAEQTITDTQMPITRNIKKEQHTCLFRESDIPNKVMGRELGIFERLYYRQGLKGADIISLMIKLESTLPITEVAVRHSIKKLMQRHPLLRMSVSKEGGLYYMHERPGSKYNFYASGRKDWMGFIKEEFDTSFTDKDDLLWRIRLLNTSKIECNSPGISTKTAASSVNPITTKDCSQQSGIPVQSMQGDDQTFHNDTESTSIYNYEATFLFILNHAIADGGYTMWLFQEFVNFLDAYNTGVNTDRIKELPLLPPLENCLSFLVDSEASKQDIDNNNTSNFRLNFCPGQGNPDVLNKYQTKFCDEIEALSRKTPKNNFILFKFNRAITRVLINACKSHRLKVNTIVVTASILALVDLLYENDDSHSEFEIPFEYMSDSRRGDLLQYEGNDRYLYPGLASLNIPLKACVHLPKRPVSSAVFWEMSRSFDKAIQNDIQTRQTIRCYHEEAKHYITHEKDSVTKGKSPFVLCFSNMGKLDGIFNDDVSKRIRLVDLHGQSSILTDDMPIFFVNTFSLNGHLYGSVSYCESFTSKETTMTYLGLLEKYLTAYSKL